MNDFQQEKLFFRIFFSVSPESLFCQDFSVDNIEKLIWFIGRAEYFKKRRKKSWTENFLSFLLLAKKIWIYDMQRPKYTIWNVSEKKKSKFVYMPDIKKTQMTFQICALFISHLLTSPNFKLERKSECHRSVNEQKNHFTT